MSGRTRLCPATLSPSDCVRQGPSPALFTPPAALPLSSTPVSADNSMQLHPKTGFSLKVAALDFGGQNYRPHRHCTTQKRASAGNVRRASAYSIGLLAAGVLHNHVKELRPSSKRTSPVHRLTLFLSPVAPLASPPRLAFSPQGPERVPLVPP
jgi:hypothetical protein